MKIGIVGSGISGLSAAHYLNKAGHDVSIFEANNYIGGHTNTISVKTVSGNYEVDTGFIVFNEKTYPHFTRLLSEIQVSSQSTNMSFSVYVPAAGLQYAGDSLSSLFADRRNIISPRFYRFLFEIKRFQRLARGVVKNPDFSTTIADFLTVHQFHRNFRDYYLYPLVSSLWSSATGEISNMPIYFVAKFFDNHALLKTVPDLPWKVISGGSSRYVKKLTQNFLSRIYLNTPIRQVIKSEGRVKLVSEVGEIGVFDKIIMAVHSDQALRILDQPSLLEHEILSQFRYSKNDVVLHTDDLVMPPNKRAWGSWNYWVRSFESSKSVLSYYMNRLQNLCTPEKFFVTLNASETIQPEKIICRLEYSHPQYTLQSLKAQSRQAELNAHHPQILYCGAYWGFGFHEDGIRSAVEMCRQERLC